MKQSALRKTTTARLRAENLPPVQVGAVEDSPRNGEDADPAFCDIVQYVLFRFAERLNMRVQEFDEIERDIRLEWGGTRCYVPKERGHGEISRRNARIRAEYRSGEHIALLARRWGLKIDTVQRIVAR